MLYGGAVQLPTAQPSDGVVVDPENPDGMVETGIPMLQKEGNYMQPFGLDGIDPYGDKVIALTFDDGPSPSTPALLDALKANDAVATFFVVGEMADIRRETLKRTFDEGHEMGTHSWNHPNLMNLSIDEILNDEYGRTNDVIEAVTGERTLFDRPPGGSMSEERAIELDRAQILWSVDTEDWKHKNDADGVNIVYNAIMNGAQDGSIILLHDLHEKSVQAAVRAIPDLIAQGYTLVSVSQMMQIAELRGYDVPYLFGRTFYALQA
jgi:peptidoglycan/xylan/chitin deacetylase (PgdA/CDA1 family)